MLRTSPAWSVETNPVVNTMVSSLVKVRNDDGPRRAFFLKKHKSESPRSCGLKINKNQTKSFLSKQKSSYTILYG